MKKLLGIVVLGLLWCNVGFAGNAVVDVNDVKIGQSAKKVCKIIYCMGNGNTETIFYPKFNTEIIINNIREGVRDYYFVFEKVAKKSKYSWMNAMSFNKYYGLTSKPSNGGILVAIIKNDLNEAKFAANPDLKKAEEQRLAEQKKQQEKPKIAEKPKKKKPKKQTPSDEKVVAAASGTGFFVSRTGHIITNHHVIEGCDAVKVSFKGNEIEAKILAFDKMNDLAIIKAKIKPNKVYSVSREDVALLEDIIIAGFPLGKKVSAAIKTSKGSITALAGYGDNYSEFQTDAALNQGNSGGPIMDQKGNVVGVAVAAFGKKKGVESFNFGIKSSTLKTFANANGLKFIPPNNREMSNKDLGQLITEGTVYLECYMTVAKIKQMIAQEENRKAFFSEYQ